MSSESGYVLQLPRSMTWTRLIEVLEGEPVGDAVGVVQQNEVWSDSRRVSPHSLYIAYRGVNRDGHEYIPEVLSRGASGVIVEERSAVPAGVPAIQVKNGRRAVSTLAALCTDYPTSQLKTFGITGTNGKTTSLWLLSRALTALGELVLEVGTLGISFEGEKLSTGESTTPSAEVLHYSARWARDRGATACVMEVSSHALDQFRADDIHFNGALFTNLTPDHLDYHRDEEEYFLAKKRLFELAMKGGRDIPVVTGVFDRFGERLHEWAVQKEKNLSFSFSESSAEEGCEGGERALTFSTQYRSDKGMELRCSLFGEMYTIETPLIGDFNARNIAGVFTLLVAAGYNPEEASRCFAKIGAPKGRMERFASEESVIFVDYAHTPDALRNALLTLRPITPGKLWVLFGCGGGRDPRRRQGMGEAARELADRIVLTSDNPREESPAQIIDDILASGLEAEFIEQDRRKAIEKTIPMLKSGDVLLIAGKGQEEYQIIGREVTFFSDQQIVQQCLKEESVSV